MLEKEKNLKLTEADDLMLSFRSFAKARSSSLLRISSHDESSETSLVANPRVIKASRAADMSLTLYPTTYQL